MDDAATRTPDGSVPPASQMRPSVEPRPLVRPPEPVDDRPSWSAMRRGLARRCPACGQGHLFEGYLKVVDRCPACGVEMHHHRADDGPAYLTILIVGHLAAFLMHFAWVQFRPDPLVFATALTIVVVGLSLFLLPRIKGAIVGFHWARRMNGFSGP